MNKRAFAALCICGIASLTIWISVSGIAPLRGAPLLAYLPRYLAASAIYVAATVIMLRAAPNLPTAPTFAATLLLAILFRAPLLTQPPTLSDDVYRYVWDGRVQNAGLNPYANRVDSHSLDWLDSPNRHLVNNPNMASPYLPVAQVSAAVLYWLAPESLAVFQLAAMGFDLLTGVLIALALNEMRVSPLLALVYLWNPLAVIEFAHGAHVDAMMNALMIAAVLAEVRRRQTNALVSPALLALSTLIKPVGVLLLPALVWRWKIKRTLVYCLAVLLGLMPYVAAGLGLGGEAAGVGLFGAMRIYLAYWRFNGGAFNAVQWLAMCCFDGEASFQLAKITTLAALGLVALWSFRRSGVAQGNVRQWSGWLFAPVAAYVLLSPTVHPWYLAAPLALLPFGLAWLSASRLQVVRLLPWAYLSAAVALSYLAYVNWPQFSESEFARWWQYAPFFLMLAVAEFYLWRQRAAPTTTTTANP